MALYYRQKYLIQLYMSEHNILLPTDARYFWSQNEKKNNIVFDQLATTTHNIVFLLHWFLVQPDNLKETSLIIEQNVTQKWNTVSNKPSFLEDGRFKQSFLHKMSYLVLNSSSFVSSR
jgi:hypothetical protein